MSGRIGDVEVALRVARHACGLRNVHTVGTLFSGEHRLGGVGVSTRQLHPRGLLRFRHFPNNIHEGRRRRHAVAHRRDGRQSSDEEQQSDDTHLDARIK
ncbi:MAG: hypothetical protein R2748_34650 [Bryobacterales bacterium]